jgi:hypothetical protein
MRRVYFDVGRWAAIVSWSLVLGACLQGDSTDGERGGGDDARDAHSDSSKVDIARRDTSEPPRDTRSDLDRPRRDVAADVDPPVDRDADGSTRNHPVSRCDPLVPSACALPWPSNLYLAPDADRTTGYTVTFADDTLPAPRNGEPADPDPYRRLDGYGLGVPIMVLFPNIDTSGMASRYDVAPSMDEDASIVLLEVREDGSTERIPYWVELDANARQTPTEQVLYVRPAVVLEENTRYVVAFRDLERKDGSSIEVSTAFQTLRDGEVSDGSTLAARQSRFDDIFRILEGAGVERDSLTLAWDFHTASSDGLHGRMRTMRRKAFEWTGPKGPELTVDEVETFSTSENENIAMEVAGTFEVPQYMRDRRDGVGQVFNLNDQGDVVRNGTRDPKFLMRIPRSATNGTKQRPVLFGHGLLGSRKQVRGDIWGEMADQYGYIFVGADWTGMSQADQPAALAAAQDVENFEAIADRMHQGILEFTLLARALRRRLSSLKPIADNNISIESGRPLYAGGSQGGIYGQTVTAVSSDIRRSFLAVPGNNYSTLLRRSTNFEPFLTTFEGIYPSKLDVSINVALMQLLWNGTDPISYVHRIEGETLGSNQPDNDVLLAVAKGDWQVATVTNEHVARSEIGIPILEHYDEMRDPWGLQPVSYPRTGSGVVLFDFGNPWPQNGNVPPNDAYGDPHGKLGTIPGRVGRLAHRFFEDGRIIDVCGGSPCQFGAATSGQ